MKKRFFSLFVCTALLLSIVFSAHMAWADTSSGDGDTYTDPLSGVTFVVPDGWRQVQSNVELVYPFQVQFTSQENAASSFLYGSVDAWSELTASERSGLTRSDIDSAYIYAYEDGALIEYMAESIVGGASEVQSNAEVDDITLVTYGKNEVIEFAVFQEVFGVRIPLTSVLYVENGYMHTFLYAGTDGQATQDFHSVLSSLQAPPAEESVSGGTGSGQTGELVDKIMLLFVKFLFFLCELAFTFIFLALPFFLYRNLIRKRPMGKKVTLIIVIPYVILVYWLVMEVTRHYITIWVPLIWCWFTYRDMTRKKDSDALPKNAADGSAPQQPIKADAPQAPQFAAEVYIPAVHTPAPHESQPAAQSTSPAPQTPPAAPSVPLWPEQYHSAQDMRAGFPKQREKAPVRPVPPAPQTSPSPAATAPQASPTPSIPTATAPQTPPEPSAPSIPTASAPQTPPTPRVQFCRNCGFRLLEDSKFCSSCGTPVVPTTKE